MLVRLHTGCISVAHRLHYPKRTEFNLVSRTVIERFSEQYEIIEPFPSLGYFPREAA